jgi:siroheme synthase
VTSHHNSIVHGKLSEYLTAGRPILVLAGDSEPAQIARETHTAEVVPRTTSTRSCARCAVWRSDR